MSFVSYSLSQDIKKVETYIDLNLPEINYNTYLKYKGDYYFLSTSIFDANKLYKFSSKGVLDSSFSFPENLNLRNARMFVLNDSLCLEDNYTNEIYFLEDSCKCFVKNDRLISNLIYKDDKYNVYSIDVGEWGGNTWFEEIESGYQYEINLSYPDICYYEGIYYVITIDKVYQLANPKNLLKSKEPFNRDKVKKGELFVNYKAVKGLREVFSYDENGYFHKSFYFINAFVINQELYFFYSKNEVFKVGRLKDGELHDEITFERKVPTREQEFTNLNEVNLNKSYLFKIADENDFMDVNFRNDTCFVKYLINKK